MLHHYESDISKFLKKYKQDHPDLEMRQREGRSHFWEKKIPDSEIEEDSLSECLSQKPYVYYD